VSPLRHVPCVCGSRQAFADCCAVWEQAFRRLGARLLAFAHRPAVRERVDDAESVFDVQGARRGAAVRLASLRFVEWFLHDFEPEPGGGTLLGEFADQAGGLSWHEEQLLLNLLLAPRRGYQVTEALGPRGLLLRDLSSGAEGPAGPLGLPEVLIPSDLAVVRLVGLGGARRPGLSLVRLPATAREELLAYLRTAYGMARAGRHVAFEDFLDGNAHLYHHFYQSRGKGLGATARDTLPPEVYAPAAARYAVRDAVRLRAALARQPEIEPEPAGEGRFLWLDLEAGIVRARLTLAGERLEVAGDTREALRDARRFAEAALRGLVQLPPEVAARPAEAAGAVAERPRGQAFLRRVLSGWAEAPSVLLRGRVPAAVLTSAAGRQEVVAALQGLERDLARQRRLRRAWVDLGPVRERLGLAEGRPPAPRRG